MYRVFLSLLILSAALLNPLFVLAESRTIVTRRPVYNNRFNNRHYHRPPNRYYNNRRPYYRPNNFYNNAYNQRRFFHPRRSSFSDLSALEQYTLNRNFTRESDLERLQRLEMQAFGAVQQGDINTRYDNVRNAILSRPKNNYRTSLIRNIGNFFGGQLTGFTPSFNSSFDDDPFFSSNSSFTTTQFPFGSTSTTGYSSPFGKGYRVNNFGTGSSTGVHILD